MSGLSQAARGSTARPRVEAGCSHTLMSARHASRDPDKEPSEEHPCLLLGPRSLLSVAASVAPAPGAGGEPGAMWWLSYPCSFKSCHRGGVSWSPRGARFQKRAGPQEGIPAPWASSASSTQSGRSGLGLSRRDQHREVSLAAHAPRSQGARWARPVEMSLPQDTARWAPAGSRHPCPGVPMLPGSPTLLGSASRFPTRLGPRGTREQPW